MSPDPYCVFEKWVKGQVPTVLNIRELSMRKMKSVAQSDDPMSASSLNSLLLSTFRIRKSLSEREREEVAVTDL